MTASKPHSILPDIREAFRTRGDEGVEIRMQVLDAVQRLEEQLEATREALEAIADGVRPADLPTWHSGKSWRIALASRALSRLDDYPAREYVEDMNGGLHPVAPASSPASEPAAS